MAHTLLKFYEHTFNRAQLIWTLHDQ